MKRGTGDGHRQKWLWLRLISAVFVLSSVLVGWLVISGPAYGSPATAASRDSNGKVHEVSSRQLGGQYGANTDQSSGIGSTDNSSHSDSGNTAVGADNQAAIPTPSISSLTFSLASAGATAPQTVTYTEPSTLVPFSFPSVFLSPTAGRFMLQNNCSGLVLKTAQKCSIQVTSEQEKTGTTWATLEVIGFPSLDVSLRETDEVMTPAPPSSVSAVATQGGAIVSAVIARAENGVAPVTSVTVTPHDITTNTVGTSVVEQVASGYVGTVTVSVTGLPANVYDFSVIVSNSFGSSIAVTTNTVTVVPLPSSPPQLSPPPAPTPPPDPPVNVPVVTPSLASTAPASPPTTVSKVIAAPIVAARSSQPVIYSFGPTSQPAVASPSQPPSYIHISEYSIGPLEPAVHGAIIFYLSQTSGIPGSMITLLDRALPIGCVRPMVLFGNQVVATPTPVGGLLPRLRIAVPGDAASGPAAITVTCIGAPATARTVDFMVYVPSVHLGMLSTAILLPSQISFSAKSLAKSAAVAALAIPFVAFPTEFLNATLEEHEDDLIALRNRFRRKKGSTGGGITSKISNNVRLSGVLLVSALLYGLLDPKFSFNESSLLIFLGLLVGLTVITMATDLPAALYLRRKDPEAKVQGHVLPGAIGIAAVCVVISRALHFEPGYLYGMVAGLQVANKIKISESDSGKAQVLSFMTTLAVALAAWLARQPLSSWTHSTHASVVAVGVDAALVSIFIAGVQGVLISLLPLRYLPGRDIFKWNRAVWAVLLGISAFIFFHLLLGQGSSYVGTINGTIAAAIFTGLFVGTTIFAWIFFAIRDRKREAKGADDPEWEAKEDEDRVSFSLSSASGSQSEDE